MMSPDNYTTPPPACSSKQDHQPNANPKKANSNSNSSSSSKANQQEQAALNCPRCDSPNTKFCYYNNYSLTQPRHFCKTCRRYWTKGGALRNVIIGGGCRKNKKIKSSSSDVSSLSSSSDLPAALKFFHGVSPAVDFQLGGLSFPRITPSPAEIYSNVSNSYAADTSNIALDPSASSRGTFVGFNHPFSSQFTVGAPETVGSMNVNSNLASSIESLSSINQDLHWKLQQQRLAMLLGNEPEKENENENENGVVPSSVLENNPVQKPQPITFQNLEVSKKPNDDGGIATEWFFGNSYEATTNGGNNDDGNLQGSGNWNNWGDLQHQYSGLP